VNVFGAPALSVTQFPSYRQDLIVGIGVLVSAPLGQYDETKLLNLGTDRWAVRTELGVSKAVGPVTLEVIPAITLFTTNDHFFGGKTLDKAHHSIKLASSIGVYHRTANSFLVAAIAWQYRWGGGL
jgi:hypothetical protein